MLDSPLRFWKVTYEYRRILEILDDYWLTEPNEESVGVTMLFIHSDGREQEKVVRWRNPNIPSKFQPLETFSAYELARKESE